MDGETSKVTIAWVLVYLAREFGWTHQHIVDSLTLTQIRRYFDEFVKIKRIERVNNCYDLFYSFAASGGNIKTSEFNNYINEIMGVKKQSKANKTIDDMKLEGLPVEEK